MKPIKSILISTTLLLFSFSLQAASSLNNPSMTDTVHLKKDCTGISDCAETLSELIPWIWNIRTPSAGSPLLVKIGAGTFVPVEGSLASGTFCSNSGHVTFIGSGKENTIIKSDSSLVGISITNCQNLVFQDLTFDLQNTVYGLFWVGDGNSHYTNVQLLGGDVAWYDYQCSANGKSVHYFTSSQIKAKTLGLYGITTAYLSKCGETWFIGSEIVAESTGIPASTIFAEGSAEIHIYGSSLRALSAAGVDISGGGLAIKKALVATTSLGNANVHIHGTGIDLISQEGNDVTALLAKNGGHIHANQSAFVLETGAGGVKTRLENNGGMIMAPYVWGDVANTTGVISLHGADISVSTDNADGQPHMLIYSTNCASSWFDSTANQCRL